MASEKDPSATDFVESHAREAIKQYIVYDGSGRMTETYTALTNAKDGDQCMKTQYAYDGATTRVIQMKESLTTWDSSWDI